MSNEVIMDDFNAWAEQNIRIIHPTRGLIPWQMYSYQKDLTKTIDENKYVIINKFRQGGISTYMVAYALWDAIEHPGRKIMFFAKTDREAIYLHKIMNSMDKRRFFDDFPDSYYFSKDTYSDNHEIVFNNGSHVWFCSPRATCGINIDHLFIDEAAFIENMDEHWEAIFPCLSAGKCTVASTPRYNNEWFYHKFTGAIEGKNAFKAVTLNYKDHPEFNSPEWERKMRLNFNRSGFLSEYCGVFVNPPGKIKEINKPEIMHTRNYNINLTDIMSDYDILVEWCGYTPEKAQEIISRMKIQKLEELKMQVMAQNPQLLRVGVPGNTTLCDSKPGRSAQDRPI